ncbi:MAG: TonB-dependent receptor [Pyrinomonadaceae bacterium]
MIGKIVNGKFYQQPFVALLLIFLFGQTAEAQTIVGKVTDAKNAAIQNAQVALFYQKSIVAQTLTDNEGKFALNASNNGNFLLRVNATGFAGFARIISNYDAQNFSAPLTIVLSPQAVNNEVTISVTGNETRLSETPASVVVLNRQTLENSAAETIDDALRQVPGFTLFRRASSKTSNPTTQGANLRGIGGSGAARTSVLFDGTSLNDAFGGWTYWNRIPRAAIEQIEVLRGGASSVYGSGGLSGAINILSKKPNDNFPVLRVESSGGTEGTLDGSLFAAVGKGGWNFDLGAETFQTAGYFPTSQETRGRADARANSRHDNGFSTIEKKIAENNRIFVRGNIFAERRDNGTSLQKNRTYFRQAAAGSDFGNAKVGSFTVRSFAETQVYDQTFAAVSVDRNTENLSRIQRVPSRATGASVNWLRPFAKQVLSSSFDIKSVSGFSDETIFSNNRAVSIVGAGGRQISFGVFAQDFWRVNSKLTLNFGGRFDFWRNANALSTTRNLTGNQSANVIIFPEKREKAFSPQISALYQINSKLGASVSFNKSFRAPTLNELYRAFRVGNVLTLANENLRAERATNFEGGLRYAFWDNKLNLRGTAFTTKVSNPVVSVTVSQTPNLITRQRQSLGSTRSSGLELDLEANLRRDWSVSAGYLLVDARVKSFPANAQLIDNFLPQVARQQFTFQTFYRPEKYSVGLQGRIMGAQFDDDQNQFRLRPFFTLDTFASRRLLKNLEIFAAGENIFNKRYDIALTPTLNIGAPRSVRIGLRFNLGKN